MSHAIDILNNALRGDPGGISFLEQTDLNLQFLSLTKINRYLLILEGKKNNFQPVVSLPLKTVLNI